VVPGFWDVSQGQRITSPKSATLGQTAVENLTLIGIYVLNTVVSLLNCSAEGCYTVPAYFIIYLFIPLFIYLFYRAIYHLEVLCFIVLFYLFIYSI